jgi:hypothetical protein
MNIVTVTAFDGVQHRIAGTENNRQAAQIPCRRQSTARAASREPTPPVGAPPPKITSPSSTIVSTLAAAIMITGGIGGHDHGEMEQLVGGRTASGTATWSANAAGDWDQHHHRDGVQQGRSASISVVKR